MNLSSFKVFDKVIEQIKYSTWAIILYANINEIVQVYTGFKYRQSTNKNKKSMWRGQDLLGKG